MSTAVILLKQVVMMFLLAGVGYALVKAGKISKEGSKSIGSILLTVSLPCVIVNGFLVERTPERLLGLAWSAGAAAVILALSMLIAWLFFPRDGVACFAGAFSNPGFFGVPLITALLGNGAVFYIAAYIAFLNLLQWSWGVQRITGDKGKITPMRVLTAPFMIAILIGLFFFLTQLPMPELIGKTVGHLAALNTPLAMFTVGVYFAEVDVLGMLKKPRLYLVSAVRLVVIPLAAALLLKLVPAAQAELRLAVLIAAACPVGSNVAVYAQLHGRDYPYAVETVVISTILSVATLPLLVRFFG